VRENPCSLLFLPPQTRGLQAESPPGRPKNKKIKNKKAATNAALLDIVLIKFKLL